MKVRIHKLEILLIAADERTQADITRAQVDDDNLSDHVQKERRWVPKWHVAAGLWFLKVSGNQARTPTMVASPELHLTNFRVWANVPPPFRPKSDISVPVSNDRRTISSPDGDFGIRLRMSTFNRIVVSFGFCMLCATIVVDARGQVPSDEPPPPESQTPEPAARSHASDT